MARGKRPINLPLPRCLAFAILLALALGLILIFPMLPRHSPLAEGMVSNQTLKSPRQATLVSQAMTQQKQEEAARLAEVWRIDPAIEQRQLEKAQGLNSLISQVRASSLSLAEKKQSLSQRGAPSLSPQAMELALTLAPQEWQKASAESERLLQGALRQTILPSQLETAKKRLSENLDPNLSQDQALVATEIAQSLVIPNIVLDETATALAQEIARDRIVPVEVTLEKGESILRDGEVVTNIHMEQLRAVGLLNAPLQGRGMIGASLLVTIMSLILGLYLYRFQPKGVVGGHRLLILWTILVGVVLVAKLTIPGRELYYYLFPLATGPILIAVVWEIPLAIVTAAILSLLVSYIAGYSPALFTVAATTPLDSLERAGAYFAGSLAGLLIIGRGERLGRFLIAGAATSAVTFGLILAFWFTHPDGALSHLGWYALVSLGNGTLTASLAVGILALLGIVFGLATPLHLMELSQPEQPLLRRLLTEAPGTYHHSLIVGNLAEQAAHLIGADPLIVRVGSYYHDIGKLARPNFFAENQMTGVNPHDTLDPTTSAAIISAHVKDGLKLAKAHRLPARLRDFITEHHGTFPLTYFCHRAFDRAHVEASERGDSQEIYPYAYPGPRPQSQETALVMLADATEAVVRSGQPFSPPQLEEMVDKVIADRIGAGQLDDCDLTLKDLDIIRNAFKDTLRGMSHTRIEYPSIPDQKLTVLETGETEDGNGVQRA
ncbi:MAG: HDIG domain-containing protein [Chloroflexi bacterium]|nr:HDIG domain-containing protein [Chloroflexota bacterium]